MRGEEEEEEKEEEAGRKEEEEEEEDSQLGPPCPHANTGCFGRERLPNQ